MNTRVRTRPVTAKTGTGSPFGLCVHYATLTLSRNGVACSSPATPVDNAIGWPFGCFYLGHRQGPERRIAQGISTVKVTSENTVDWIEKHRMCDRFHTNTTQHKCDCLLIGIARVRSIRVLAPCQNGAMKRWPDGAHAQT
jgi:hypothetical protein